MVASLCWETFNFEGCIFLLWPLFPQRIPPETYPTMRVVCSFLFAAIYFLILCICKWQWKNKKNKKHPAGSFHFLILEHTGKITFLRLKAIRSLSAHFLNCAFFPIWGGWLKPNLRSQPLWMLVLRSSPHISPVLQQQQLCFAALRKFQFLLQ